MGSATDREPQMDVAKMYYPVIWTILQTSPSPVLTPSPIFTSSIKSKNAAAKLRQLGLRYRQQGRYTDAIISLEEATSMEPENLSGQVLLDFILS